MRAFEHSGLRETWWRCTEALASHHHVAVLFPFTFKLLQVGHTSWRTKQKRKRDRGQCCKVTGHTAWTRSLRSLLVRLLTVHGFCYTSSLWWWGVQFHSGVILPIALGDLTVILKVKAASCMTVLCCMCVCVLQVGNNNHSHNRVLDIGCVGLCYVSSITVHIKSVFICAGVTLFLRVVMCRLIFFKVCTQ